MKIESFTPNIIGEALAFEDVTCIFADPSCLETSRTPELTSRQ